jgi:hypothetical protein
MSSKFKRESSKPLILCSLGTLVVLALGTADGIRSWQLTGAWLPYDPRVALQTATVIGVIWATYYTHSVFVRGKYDQLGKLWYDIKRHGIDLEPSGAFFDESWTSKYEYANRRGTLDNGQLKTEWAKYHVYAWMCWAFAEDCYRENVQDDEGFAGTFRHSARVHRAWFSEKENRDILDKEFATWIDKKFPALEAKAKDKSPLQSSATSPPATETVT